MLGARVLVLEHHRDLREALVEALLDEGYLVTPAPTEEAALVSLRGAGEAQIPDAAVVDAQDGRDLLDEARTDPRYARMALVTLSFPFDPPSGADVDVPRPFRLEQFLGAVRRALTSRAHGPQPPQGEPAQPSR